MKAKISLKQVERHLDPRLKKSKKVSPKILMKSVSKAIKSQKRRTSYTDAIPGNWGNRYFRWAVGMTLDAFNAACDEEGIPRAGLLFVKQKTGLPSEGYMEKYIKEHGTLTDYKRHCVEGAAQLECLLTDGLIDIN